MAKQAKIDSFGRLPRSVIPLLLGLAVLQGPPRSVPTVAAASSSIAEIAAGPVKPGKFKAVLVWSLKGLKRLSRRMHLAEPVTEAVEDLLRIVGNAQRSAELDTKLDTLAVRVGELEARLAVQAADRAEIARLREELRHGDPYKLCCESQLPRVGRPLR